MGRQTGHNKPEYGISDGPHRIETPATIQTTGMPAAAKTTIPATGVLGRENKPAITNRNTTSITGQVRD